MSLRVSILLLTSETVPIEGSRPDAFVAQLIVNLNKYNKSRVSNEKLQISAMQEARSTRKKVLVIPFHDISPFIIQPCFEEPSLFLEVK